jgi:hypothetical protein
MSIREALIAVAALVMMAPPAIAENAKNLKYALECGAAKITPPDDDSDPIYKTKIAERPHIRQLDESSLATHGRTIHSGQKRRR